MSGAIRAVGFVPETPCHGAAPRRRLQRTGRAARFGALDAGQLPAPPGLAAADAERRRGPVLTRPAYESIPGTRQGAEVADGHFGLLYHPGVRFREVTDLPRALLVDQI